MTAGAAGAYGLGAAAIGKTEAAQSAAVVSQKDTPISRLKPMTAGIVPISDDERLARMEKARRLMAGKLFSEDLLNRVEKSLSDFRAKGVQ